MVYCGRPSQACENCRTRRIKCDQKRPGCTQCKHTKRRCLGYRDPNDVLFRDESQKVMAKFKPQQVATLDNTEQPMVKTNRSPSPPVVEAPDPVHNGYFQTIQPKVEDIAVNFLLTDFLRGSHFRYLPQLYASSNNQCVLQPVVKAVALAGLAQHSGRQQLHAEARRYHVEAVATLKEFLEHPESAMADEVMATILLLSLYETVTMQKVASLEAWEMHSRGALALLTMRGSEQFNSKFGIELFTQTTKIIKLFYLQRRLKLPDELRRLTAEAKEMVKPGTITLLDYSHLIEGFMDLWADMAHGDLTNPYKIIMRADALLHSMEIAETDMPGKEQYYRISARIRDPQSSTQQKAGLLAWDPFTAQIWQNLWMARVELNALVCNQYSTIESLYGEDATFLDTESLLEASEHCQNALEAAEDIYVTVQQFFPDAISSKAPPKKLPDPAAGYFSIWPMFTIGSCDYVDAHFRNKIIAKLDYIAAVMNLPQAQKAAEALQSGIRTEDWMHIYHVF